MEALLRSLSDCYQSVALSLLAGVASNLQLAEELQLNHRRFRVVKKVRAMLPNSTCTCWPLLAVNAAAHAACCAVHCQGSTPTPTPTPTPLL